MFSTYKANAAGLVFTAFLEEGDHDVTLLVPLEGHGKRRLGGVLHGAVGLVALELGVAVRLGDEEDLGRGQHLLGALHFNVESVQDIRTFAFVLNICRGAQVICG